ncbi:sulfur carrier protein ThiS [Candidatus Ruminimicrobium bovinum]|uniref:sulfur carrier protein ThiS n=1 Tax=Candidatus Ruminimicrobium bovinum TaxID=3242779 RepID=UPI0039B9C0BF
MKVNGKEIVLKNTQNISEFLQTNNYNINRIVVELNGKIVNKDKYGTINLKDTDVMEVLTFVGGG